MRLTCLKICRVSCSALVMWYDLRWSYGIQQLWPTLRHFTTTFLESYGTQMLITVFRGARHLSLSIQSVQPHTISETSTLILSSHLPLKVVAFHQINPSKSRQHHSSPITFHMPSSPLPSWFHRPSNTLTTLQAVQLLITPSPSVACGLCTKMSWKIRNMC
jgi:hypothetical protein